MEEGTTGRRPLRLWPGVAIVAAQWLAWLVVPLVAPSAAMYGVIGGVLGGGLALLSWWLFFSRAPWLERLGVVAFMVLAVLATRPLLHRSIQTGMMGMMFVLYSIPALCLALVAGLAATRRLAAGPRRAAVAGAIVLACASFTALRTAGVSGEGTSDLHWRWTPTHEERLLARAAAEPEPLAPPPAPAAPPPVVSETPAAAPSAAPAASAAETPAAAEPTPPAASPAPVEVEAQWPGFRGAGRDGVVRGVRIETDWSAAPPQELWRRPVGPGWSSFAVRGELFYTQEQRGEEEVVACHRLATGEPVWRHGDAARFWESNAGAGPRATPTLSGRFVYALGATGILNALDARDGSVVWSRNAAADTGKKVPAWGFAASPLVLDDLVIVATAGTPAAYERATGRLRWSGPPGGAGYSSPHLSRIDGVPQILLVSAAGAIGVAPPDGALLWKHAWAGDGIVQPALLAGDVLLGSGTGMGGEAGMRRLSVARGPGGWTTEERWTSHGLKPYFNDFVVHEGHAYGFDGSILSCIDLQDGRRKWKGGRYGHGQLILLADQGVLLVLSEEGELALVRAAPDQFTELARRPAIEGKTWNHPVLAGDVLLVRNGQEMAAFRLARAGP